jgi:hypothetical protein
MLAGYKNIVTKPAKISPRLIIYILMAPQLLRPITRAQLKIDIALTMSVLVIIPTRLLDDSSSITGSPLILL